MVTGFVIVIAFIIFDTISLDVFVIILIRLFLLVFKSAFNLVVVFGSKSSLSFTHGIVESSLITVVFVIVIIEDFSLFVLAVRVRDLVDDFFLLDSSSLVLHVVHV
jgi:hypothetical protein